MSSGNEKKGSYGRNLLLMLSLTAITFAVILSGNDMENFIQALKTSRFIWLLAGLGCMLIFVSCEAINMHHISRSLKRPLSLSRCEQYAFIGFYFSSVIALRQRRSAGTNVLYEKDNIDLADSSVMILFIVFVYQLAMLLFAGIMTLLHPGPAMQDSRPFKISFTLRIDYERRRRRTNGFISYIRKDYPKSPFIFPSGWRPAPPDKVSPGKSGLLVERNTALSPKRPLYPAKTPCFFSGY